MWLFYSLQGPPIVKPGQNNRSPKKKVFPVFFKWDLPFTDPIVNRLPGWSFARLFFEKIQEFFQV